MCKEDASMSCLERCEKRTLSSEGSPIQQRNYDPELFDGRVERIPVEDHNPPMLMQVMTRNSLKTQQRLIYKADADEAMDMLECFGE